MTERKWNCRTKKKRIDPPPVKVLCGTCNQFFLTPACCLECSNWNVCMACLRAEQQIILRHLNEHGITCMGIAGSET